MQQSDLNNMTSSLKSGETMPALFIGHGSPMNAIQNNSYTSSWEKLAQELPLPKAVLCISAHWLTEGTKVTAMERPRTIHDFGGFPQELFDVEYPAPGSPAIAEEIRNAIKSTEVKLDQEWGLDHGAWSVIKRMYPKANVPVLQLSIDIRKPPQYHYNLGRELASLRKQGILILGSGNMVHNLRLMAFDTINGPEFGFAWALDMKEKFAKAIQERNHAALIDYTGMGEGARLAVPTPEHYYPLLYILGLQEQEERAVVFNDVAVGGSLTMSSVKIS